MKELSVTFKKKSSELSSKKNQKSIQDKFLPKLHSIKSQRHRKKTIKNFFGRSSHSPSKSNVIKQLSASISHQNSQTTIGKVIPQKQPASEPPPLPSVDRLRSIVKRHSTCDCTISEKCLKPIKPPRSDLINVSHTQVEEDSKERIYYELDFEDHICDQKGDAIDENNDHRDPITEEENDYSELSSFLKLDGLKDSIDFSSDDTEFFFDTIHTNLLIEMKESFKRRNLFKTADRNNSDDINSLSSDSFCGDVSADYYSIPVAEKVKVNACKNYAAIEGLYAKINKKKDVNMSAHENRTVSSEECPPTVIHESTWL